MCLVTIDKKSQRHKIGFKIFETDNSVSDFFKPAIFQSPDRIYTYGMEYDAKEDSEDNKLLTLMVYCPEINSNIPYEAGFHYYRKLHDAINKICFPEQIIIKIHVREILATGSQYNFPMGVSRYMTLIEPIISYKKDIKTRDEIIEKEYMKECKKYDGLMLEFFDLLRKNKVFLKFITPEKAFEIQQVSEPFLKTLVETKESYYHWVAMTDKMSRSSKVFRCCIAFHNAHFHTHPYSGIFSTLINEQRKTGRHPALSMLKPKCPNHIDKIVFG